VKALASKRRLRRCGCESKQRHDSRADACRHRDALLKAGKHADVYACGKGWNVHWHVGRLDHRGVQSLVARRRHAEGGEQP